MEGTQPDEPVPKAERPQVSGADRRTLHRPRPGRRLDSAGSGAGAGRFDVDHRADRTRSGHRRRATPAGTRPGGRDRPAEQPRTAGPAVPALPVAVPDQPDVWHLRHGARSQHQRQQRQPALGLAARRRPGHRKRDDHRECRTPAAGFVGRDFLDQLAEQSVFVQLPVLGHQSEPAVQPAVRVRPAAAAEPGQADHRAEPGRRPAEQRHQHGRSGGPGHRHGPDRGQRLLGARRGAGTAQGSGRKSGAGPRAARDEPHPDRGGYPGAA